jgi:hypothetical protein
MPARRSAHLLLTNSGRSTHFDSQIPTASSCRKRDERQKMTENELNMIKLTEEDRKMADNQDARIDQFDLWVEKYYDLENTSNEVYTAAKAGWYAASGAKVPPNTQLIVTVHDEGIVSLWTEEGMSGSTLVRIFRAMADGFESGEVRRIGE